MKRGRKKETAAAKRARLDFYQQVFEKGACQIPLPHACDGPIDPCHVIDKQHIKWVCRFDRKLSEADMLAIVWDPRNGIPGCRQGHTMFDSPFYKAYQCDLPDSVFEFAADYGFTDRLRDMYPADGAVA